MVTHGGDVYRNAVKLDFSVNVNPLGMPDAVKMALHEAVALCGRYPDQEAEKLKRAVSGRFLVPEEALLFGNGASELFMALVHAIKPKKTVIPIPSFYGYEYAAEAIESEIVSYVMKLENDFAIEEDFYTLLTKEVDLLFLANPNNPTGKLLEKETIRRILRHCRENGIYVALDECFIEFCGRNYSMLSEIESFDTLILIRAFTKIFALPGVRLGYLICKNRTLLAKIAGQLPEWNLSCFAQEAGCICMEQEAFLIKTEHYVKKERMYLEEGLRQKGFFVVPSMANFILFFKEQPLYERLLEKGILIRDCRDFRGLGRGFYRVAVKRREENEILLKSL